MDTPEARLASLGLTLPPAPKVMGVYHGVVVVGELAYTSGHGPLKEEGGLVVGKLLRDDEKSLGYAAAQLTALAILATMKQALGELSRIERVVKVLGLVNCGPEFTMHPAVINGCSELFRELWGEQKGVAARSAFGAASLPAGMLVEIEAIFQIKP